MDREPSTVRWVIDGTGAEKTFVSLQDEASRDVEAALAWLKTRPEIDAAHLVMSGVSFGGIQTLLAAEKGLGVRAFVAFAPGAMSWRHVPALRARLQQAAERAQAPVLVVQARNDSDLAPSEVLGAALERAAKGRAVLFPAFGTSEREGHGAFACRREGTAIWGPTVLDFFRASSR
jgi:dienelactone hydrolase